MGFKEFVTEDSDAVISQIRKIRGQMRVIKLKRDLEKEKDELQTLKQMKRSEYGVMKL
jgi:DNA-binding FrmR family transcriptional regulator